MQRNSMKTISNMYITFSVPLFSQGIPILNAMEFCSNLEIPMNIKLILCLQMSRTKPWYRKTLDLWKCAKHRTNIFCCMCSPRKQSCGVLCRGCLLSGHFHSGDGFQVCYIDRLLTLYEIVSLRRACQ